MRSPFARLVATGYYDGPIDGLVECATCSTIYSFRKLDWDNQQDTRIFSLSPIPGHSIDEFTAGGVAPTWPAWVLADRETEAVASGVDEMRRAASPEEFIVATEDLLGTIEAWRPVGLIGDVDWFSELGLDREGSGH
ncbi:MAG: hypothetical protein HYV07_08410 [Deltaproteobacteria bacterium]|nr:hypothetical protein [Deltaproteobacteria bacterium]